MRLSPLALLLALPLAARAGERFDHRGAVSLRVGGGAGGRHHFSPSASDSGYRSLLHLGGTWSLGEGELAGWARASLGGAAPAWSALLGYRSYYGYDRLKTFLDLDLAVELRPILLAGPRVGGGLQLELSPNVGLFLGAAFEIALGDGVGLSGELFAGLQLRSYLLE